MDTVSRNWRRSTTFPRTIRCGWLCVVPTASSRSYQLGVAYGYNMTCLNAQWSRLCAVPLCQYLKCWCTFPNRAVVDAKPFKSYIAFTHLFIMKSIYLHLEGTRETHACNFAHTCSTIFFSQTNVLQMSCNSGIFTIWFTHRTANQKRYKCKCKTYL